MFTKFTNRMANEIIEAFKVYQREYQNKSEKEIKTEIEKLFHCHELVVNNLNK